MACRRQAIIWTNAGILLNGPWGTNFSEILIGIQTFSFKKMHLKMSSAIWRPFCLGLNVLIFVSLRLLYQLEKTYITTISQSYLKRCLFDFISMSLGGKRANLPSPRWCPHGRLLREVFANVRFFRTTNLSAIYIEETQGITSLARNLRFFVLLQ